MQLLTSDWPLFIIGQARCSMETTRFEPGSAGYEAAALHLCYLARQLIC